MIRDVMHFPPFLSKETINTYQFLQVLLEDHEVHISFALLVDVCRSALCMVDLVYQNLKTLVFDFDIVILGPGIFISVNCKRRC